MISQPEKAPIIVASVQNQTYDDQAFVVGGVDINQYQVLGLKSTQHFKAFFKPLAKAIIPCNPMGIVTGDLSKLDYQKTPRPIFPLN